MRITTLLLLAACAAGCRSGEVLVWHSQATFPPTEAESVRLLRPGEWRRYQEAHPALTAEATRIASIRAADEDDLRELAARLGGHFVVDFSPYAYVVPRRTQEVTAYLWGRTFEFDSRHDQRGTVVRFAAARPPAPAAEPRRLDLPGVPGLATEPLPAGSIQ